jgi:predicted DNA-binding transcriptional regulator AlpA
MNAWDKLRLAEGQLAKLPLLHTQDLIEILGVHERTIYRWRELGVLPPPVYVGATPYWRAEDFLRWLWTNGGARPRQGRRQGQGDQ